MRWWARYIGIPFVDGGRDMGGLDCWGLVRIVYADELGIDLPRYGEVSARDLATAAGLIEGGQERWFEPDAPREFDGVLMRVGPRNHPAHCGVYVGRGSVLHVERGVETHVQELRDPLLRHRVVGFRRHETFR